MKILVCLIIFTLSSTSQGYSVALTQSDTIFNQTDHLNRKQGHWRKVYRNGKRAYEGFFKDDKPRGTFIRYHESGAVSVQMLFSACGDTAQTTMYSTAGKVLATGIYLNTKKHGVWNYLGASGNVVYTEEFSHGLKHGKFLTYYPNGAVFEQIAWRNDKKNGSTVQYYPDGSTKSMVFYKDGVEEGPIRTYYASGEVRLEGKYSKGLKEGQWRILSPEGNPIKEILYVNGVAQNQDELMLKETKELELLLKNIGKIQEPSVEEFVRGVGF